MSRRRWAALMAGGSLALGGCVGLHPDPAISPGLTVGADSQDRVVYVPPGPQENSTAEAIIRGFVRANASSGEGITVARSYLTRTLAGSWNPDARTDVVSTTDGELRQVKPGLFELTSTLLGQVGDDGRYVPATVGKTSTLRLKVISEGGQWRISALPEGVGRWLARSAFNQLMSPVPLHYVSLGDPDTLIPDVRWFVRDQLASRLTRAQLGPIPSYLVGAVRTDLANLHLVVDAVPVRAGVASVDFAAARVSPDPRARRGMWGQLVATLTAAPNVSAVDVTVEGAALDVDGVSPPVARSSELGFRESVDPIVTQPLLRVGQGVYSVDPARFGQPGLDLVVEQSPVFPPITEQFTDLALAATGKELAAVAQGELARFRASEVASVPNFGTHLTGPAYDQRGWLFVGGRAGAKAETGAIWAVDTGVWPPTAAGGQARRISVPWLADRRPVAVAISADGARAAVVSTDAEDAHVRLDVVGVVRDDAGAPTGLSAMPIRLAPSLQRIRDVVWIDSTELAVLAATTAKDPVVPQLVTLGQQVQALPEVADARHISTLGGERRLVVTAPDGVFLRAGGTWQRVGVGEDIVVAGR